MNLSFQGLLFLGPGYGSYGQSEVLSLPSLRPSSCSIATHPSGHVYATVGTISQDGQAIICGGYNYDSETTLRDCYTLGKEWVMTQPMPGPRASADAANLEGGWWVTGGAYDGDEHVLDSTLLLKDGEWHAGEDLPEGVHGHCMVQLNQTHVFYSGGFNGQGASASSFIYSEMDGFVPQMEMSRKRYNHGCVLRNNEVWVAGGYSESVEIFSMSSGTWESGPALPFSAIGGEMVDFSGDISFIGGYGDNGNKIFQLDEEEMVWKVVGEMETVRVSFILLEWNSDKCDQYTI